MRVIQFGAFFFNKAWFNGQVALTLRRSSSRGPSIDHLGKR